MIKNAMLWHKYTLLAALLMLPVGLLAAPNVQEHVDKAEKYLAEGEVRSAVIELKNALQREPMHVDARIMLGNIYLKTGDAASAEKEFRRVSKLHVAQERWLKEMGHALLLQRKYKEALETVKPDAEGPGNLTAELLIIRGLAHQGLDQLEQAEKAYQESRGLDPENSSSLIAMAQLALKRGQREEAAALVNQVLEKEPENIRALMIRGDLARQARRFDQAEEDLTKIITINPQHPQARLARATIRLAKGEFDRVPEDLGIVEKRFPDSPAAQYLRALLAFQSKEYDKAAELLQLALRNNPKHIQSQWLYGMTSYAKGDLETAGKYLSSVVAAMPENIQAVKLLAATRMKLKQPKAAIEVLEQTLAKHPKDPQLMALLGSAYLHSGEQEKGADMLSKAIAIEPDLAILRTELAMSLLAQGETEEAITELKSAVDLGQGVVQADILLVLSHLQKKEYEKALAASKALEKRMPESPIPFNLTGLAYLYKGDTRLAAEQFNKALAIDPGFFTAEMNLARIDFANKDSDAMERRYKSILSKSEKHLGALLGMADLVAKKGENEEVEKWLKKAYQLNPELPQPGIALTRYYLNLKKPLKALPMVNALLQKFPKNPNVLKTVADAQLAAGEINSAIRNYEILAEQQPAAPGVWLLLARAQLKRDEQKNARASLQQALKLKEDFTQARVILAGLELKSRNYDEASRLADLIIKNRPELSAGYEISAAVSQNRKQPEKALELYEKGYRAQPSARLAITLARQYGAVGKPEKAVATLNNWLEAEPENIAVLSMLGMQYQAMKQDTKAINAYQKVHELAPENLLVLNNLAWLYQTRGDKKALILSKKAYELAPETPEIVDTYGWILVKFGEQERGLQILQQAFVSAPTNPEIGYHVAYALHKTGRGEEAKKMLKRNLRDYPESPVVNEVEQLLKQLE